MEVHLISGNELHFYVVRIRIALWSRLGFLPVFSDKMHLIFCLLQNFRPENQPFAGFGPVERCTALSSVQHFKWGHLETGLEVVVV